MSSIEGSTAPSSSENALNSVLEPIQMLLAPLQPLPSCQYHPSSPPWPPPPPSEHCSLGTSAAAPVLQLTEWLLECLQHSTASTSSSRSCAVCSLEAWPMYVSILGHCSGCLYHFACYACSATTCCMAYKAKDQMLENAPHATVCCMAYVCFNFRPLLRLFVSNTFVYCTLSKFLFTVCLFKYLGTQFIRIWRIWNCIFVNLHFCELLWKITNHED